jgi:peptidoglycan/LPS O-acetylase OafA/YrhL
MSETSTGYRPEIDGLRAVAILAVVAYHVGVPGFSGGFVGVDVFFVISGFLITGLLLDEHRRHGAIDLLAFYARRARRLLPAFVLVVLVTLLLGLFFLLPVKEEQSSLARSAVYAAIYASNVFFARHTGGYFDGPTDLLPLLHTWSLSVEEQFYLAWPPLLIILGLVASRLRLAFARLVLVALIAVLTLSFAYGWQSSLGDDKAAQAGFYLIFSRAWELAIGALLALATPYVAARSRALGEALCVAGLVLIAVAITAYDPTMLYPGVAAALPTLGAGAAIAGATLAPGAWTVRALSVRPAVAIGLVSYGWYLWHWPLLAIARTEALGVRDLARDSAIALAALALAWLTYRFVEDPIRRKRAWGTWSNPRLLAIAAAASVAIIACAQAMDFAGTAVARVTSSGYARARHAMNDVSPALLRCNHNPPFTGLRARETCTVAAAGQGGSVLLWGDSHADHLMPLLEAALSRINVSVLRRSMIGCPPLMTVRPMRRGKPNDDCVRFNLAVFEETRRLKEQDLVGIVMSGRWSNYQERPAFNKGDQGERRRLFSDPPNGRGAIEVLEDGMRATLSKLTDLGLKVLVMAPAPEQPYHAPLCLARRDVVHCSVSRHKAEAYRENALGALTRAVAAVPGSRLFDSFPALCDDHHCPVERDGTILYRDDDHLTASGARSLAPWFAEAARWLAEPSREAALRGTQ